MANANAKPTPSVYGDLLPQHVRLLEESAIAPEIARARGYKSVSSRRELLELGFAPSQCRVPCLLLPVCDVHGRTATYQIRPDKPRMRDGRPVKYETPLGSRMVLDVPPAVRPLLADPKIPLLVTEGIRKADAAISRGLTCIALLGVFNFRGRNEHGGKVALADWESVALNDRQVYLVFDSDVMLKPEVETALRRLKAFLETRDAKVAAVYLSPGPGGTKTGLDDFLARGGTVERLLALATTVLQDAPAAMYERTPHGLVWRKVMGTLGAVRVPLTNFDARIVADIVEDDDAETRRFYELEVTLNGRRVSICVSATEFPAMTWPGEHLGAGAIVYAGHGRREHARVAIQQLSGTIPERRVFTHTGWRQLADGLWGYLHALGAIGSTGTIAGAEIVLPKALSRYRLVLPSTGDELVFAIRAVLRFLDVAPARITIPLFAAIWRAVLGGTDFSIYLTGDTGAGKTALLVLTVQHFGAEWDERVLPSWSSTGNSLEGLAFQAKDAILAVDDWAPSADPNDAKRLQRDADRLFRAQGNVTGRMRMRADTTLRPPRPPRGLIVSTGEDVPRGQSLRARILMIHVEKGTDAKSGDMDWTQLTRCQQDAARGLYAMTTAAFIRWLAPRYEEVRRNLRASVQQRRAAIDLPMAHRRTPGIVADLAVGFEYFLSFAREAAAITDAEATALAKGAQAALEGIAQAQQVEQATADPVRRFLELLAAAIAGGRAHLAGPDGDSPEPAQAWGWRAVTVGAGDDIRTEWRPQGERIGWLSGDDHYLEPDVAYAAAQRLAREQGETLAISPKTLHKRLKERQLLVATESERNTVRRHLEGKERYVLWLRADGLLSQESSKSSESDRA